MNTPTLRSPVKIAQRCLILHGMVAWSHGINAHIIDEWWARTEISDQASPVERELLFKEQASQKEVYMQQWRAECQWTLLWSLGKIPLLGDPSQTCDTALVCDTLIPGLDDDASTFIHEASLRASEAIEADDEQSYNAWCDLCQAQRQQQVIDPQLWNIMYQRRCAFEWLTGNDAWDEITCDA